MEKTVCARCGQCCQGFHISVGNLNKDMKNYFELHKIEIKNINGQQMLYIRKRCIRLCYNLKQDNYFCMDYENRPTVCKEAYTEQTEGVIFPKDCVFNPK